MVRKHHLASSELPLKARKQRSVFKITAQMSSIYVTAQLPCGGATADSP
jgi:hypothetical protein